MERESTANWCLWGACGAWVLAEMREKVDEERILIEHLLGTSSPPTITFAHRSEVTLERCHCMNTAHEKCY